MQRIRRATIGIAAAGVDVEAGDIVVKGGR
jgi:hypothetical protein